MRDSRIFTVVSLLGICASARAVYAPIPEQQQGKDFTVSVSSGVMYDNNIFGAYTDAIGSTMFMLSPDFIFNKSLTQETFLSADYRLTLDYFLNRPGEKLLDNHNFDARLAHAFSKVTILDLTDSLVITHNPESALSGVPINSDQSYLSNEGDIKLALAPTQKTGVILKARTTYFDYFDTNLGDELNRYENLFGMEGDYTLLPDLKAAGEYRHQDVDYIHNSALNDKHSDFLMAGADYAAGPKLTASFRLGEEWRRLSGDGSQAAPHAELTLKYDYAKGSYVAGGYSYDLTETSDPVHFSDERTNRAFLTIQHSVTALIVASASVDYEPGTLVGLAGLPNVHETVTHMGAALTYLPTKNWAISATYDYDYTDSGEVTRGMNRSRVGVNGTFTF